MILVKKWEFLYVVCFAAFDLWIKNRNFFWSEILTSRHPYMDIVVFLFLFKDLDK